MDNKLLNELEKSGAITIKKVPNVILICTCPYHKLEDWDFQVN